MSFLSYYECSRCGEKHDANEIQNICRKCDSGPLLVRYDLESVTDTLKPADLICRDADMWRYHELLPVNDTENIVSMGEGWTPLIKLDNIGKALGLSNVYLKDEGLFQNLILVSQDPVSTLNAGILAVPWQNFLSDLWEDKFV